MPSLASSGRHQKAVLWAATGNFDNEGDALISSPVEITVRWEEVLEEAVDPNGNTVAVDAKITVDRVITVGSILWLGELIDLPSPPTELKQVIGRNHIPGIKSRQTYRSLMLMRYSDTLPTIE